MRSKAKGPALRAKVLPPKVPTAVRIQAITGAAGPTLSAYGGRCAYSGNREVRAVVYWITTVAARAGRPRCSCAGEPPIRPTVPEKIAGSHPSGPPSRKS